MKTTNLEHLFDKTTINGKITQLMSRNISIDMILQ